MPPAARAIDFATHTVHGDPITDGEKDEVIDTLRELVAFFGVPAITRAVADLGITGASGDQSNERVMQALRAYSCLILESPRRLMTAQLVGKLAGMEITTGKRIRLQDIATAEGISKQAVSKNLATYAERLGLPRPDSTEEARASYRACNRRNYSAA